MLLPDKEVLFHQPQNGLCKEIITINNWYLMRLFLLMTGNLSGALKSHNGRKPVRETFSSLFSSLRHISCSHSLSFSVKKPCIAICPFFFVHSGNFPVCSAPPRPPMSAASFRSPTCLYRHNQPFYILKRLLVYAEHIFGQPCHGSLSIPKQQIPVVSFLVNRRVDCLGYPDSIRLHHSRRHHGLVHCLKRAFRTFGYGNSYSC